MAASRASVAVADVAARGLVTWGLYAGLLAFAGWVGHAVLEQGGWLGTDRALYRAANGVELGPLTGALFALLNDPGPAYFAVIVVLLAYCGWRRRALLPAAALAVGVALALGQAATHAVHHAGTRERPVVSMPDARTPIAACAGPVLLTRRGAAGPTASCDGTPADLVGLDWRTIWLQFPSFPSGHVRETAALCVLLAGFWRRSWPLALGYLLIMAFSRVHFGAHYPTDVAGGALIGIWAGATTLLGLDLVRRVAQLLGRVPPVRAGWDWVTQTRIPGRPDLDPLGARLLRIAAYGAGAVGTLYALGFALVSGEAGQLYSVLQNADYSAYGALTSQFDPEVGRLIYFALGPAGLLYAALALAALAVPALTAGPARRSQAAFAALTLAVSVGLAFLLQLAGAQWFQRPQPFTQVAEAPIPPEWRAAWLAPTSFPNWHVVLIAALGAQLLRAGRVPAILGQVVALAAAVGAVYSGGSWLTDALASYTLGTVTAAVARYVVRQLVPGPPVAQADVIEGPGAQLAQPRPA